MNIDFVNTVARVQWAWGDRGDLTKHALCLSNRTHCDGHSGTGAVLMHITLQN